MRPLPDQTILVTGATDGHGRALAGTLAAAGATVLVHGRGDRRGRETIDELSARARNGELHWYRADFASLHASYTATKIVRADGITPSSSIDEGVEATLRLVAAPELDGVTGRYFNGAREAAPHAQARDPEARRQLRELSEDLVAAV